MIRNHGATAGIGSGYPVLVALVVLTLAALAAALTVRATQPASDRRA